MNANAPLSTLQSTRSRALLLIGLLLAFALRLYHLGGESLWYDETVSAVLAEQSPAALIAHTARDIHPPGYYLLLHGWQRLTHPTLAHGLEFLYAWPSLWFGVVIVALLYALGRRFYGASSALTTLWLAAINPFHLWYSQEVRMYTLGASLGLLCWWALLKFFEQKQWRARIRWLFVYALCGAVGLYTLYYFLFTLAALNLIALSIFWRRRHQVDVRRGLAWLGAQALIVLFYVPWLPTLWRQATDPPVPPWRTAWSDWPSFAQAVSESLAALLVGQSPPGLHNWPWALLTVSLVAIFYYTKVQSTKTVQGRAQPPNNSSSASLLSYLFVPIGLIYLLTLVITPIYHVRYLFVYAPPFLILVAEVVQQMRRWKRWLGTLTTLLLITTSGWGLLEFWSNPLYRADDHRAAVAQLAQQWRPGDLILVNAGWVYTALQLYWPTTLVGADAALPPPISRIERITDYAQKVKSAAGTKTSTEPTVTVVRTGSIDGAASLGWGDPSSDFFAMPSETITSNLTEIASHHTRIWHYRLYDTVNDPNGLICTWLDANPTPVLDIPFSGRDYLRLQQYATKMEQALPSGQGYTFGNTIRLLPDPTPATVAAGEFLYLSTKWLALPDIETVPGGLSMSLRLYDADGQMVAQQDATPGQATNTWQPTMSYTVPLALPVPVATKPGTYELALIVYAADTGTPLLSAQASGDGRISLGVVQITPARQPPEISDRLARFDYIDLVTAQISAARTSTATPINLRLIWRPWPNAYQETYLGILELRNAAGTVVQSWSDALGGWDYPSGSWPASIPVQEWRTITIDTSIPTGAYQLTIRLARSSDQQFVPARQGWWPLDQAFVVIGNLAVE